MPPYYWQLKKKKKNHGTCMLPWICEHYTVFPLQQQEISTNCSESAKKLTIVVGIMILHIHKLII